MSEAKSVSDPNLAGVTITRACVEELLEDTLNDFEWLVVSRDIDDILNHPLDNYLEDEIRKHKSRA